MWDEVVGIPRPDKMPNPQRGEDEHQAEGYPPRLFIDTILFSDFNKTSVNKLSLDALMGKLLVGEGLEGKRSREAEEIKLLQEALEAGLDPNAPLPPEDITNWASSSIGVMESGTPHEFAWPHWNTTLHRALFMKDYASASLLVEHGADVNIRNALGKTALHEAMFRPYSCNKTVEFLVAHGADLDAATVAQTIQDHTPVQSREITSRGGLIPLHLSLFHGYVPILQTLVEAGASTNLVSPDGWSALDLALLDQQWPALTILFRHGARPSTPPNTKHLGDVMADVAGKLTQKLLSYTSTAEMFPPAECLPVYHYILEQQQCQHALQDAQSNPCRSNNFVNVFFHILRNLAHYPPPQIPSSFYDRCYEFQNLAVPTYAGIEPSSEPATLTFPSIEALHKSAGEGCAMCGIIADVLDASLPSHPCKSNSIIYDEDAYWFQHDRDAGDNAEASPLVRISLLDSPDRTRLIVRYKGYWLFKRIVKVTELEEHLTSELCYPEVNSAGSTGSDSAFRTARSWLQECWSSPGHSYCQRATPPEASVLPTRIIHVGDETSEPFLLEAKGTKAPYCVLSYCWGTSATFKTTKSVLQSHKTSIALQSLPLTIRDGVLATRALGFQYLWVDALCIIQDDEEDWGREAAQMGDIYANATVTLSSLVSSDAADGFFRPRQIRQPKPVPLPSLRLPKVSRRREQKVTDGDADTAKPPRMCVLVPHWLHREAPREGPVHSRGWTLQEQVLSARKLYFGAGLLRWECQFMHATEVVPIEHMGLARIIQKPFRAHAGTYEQAERRKQPFALRMFGLGPPGSEHLLRPIAFSIWQCLLMEYTTDRSLTRQSDRLPAFLGVSTFMGPYIGSTFIGGLWDGEWFAESLCWAVKTPIPASTTTSSPSPGNVAAAAKPSWTWASLPHAPVTFEPSHAPDREKRSLVSNVSFDHVQISSAQSRVTGAIHLRGRIGRFDKKMVANPMLFQNPCFDCVDNGVQDGGDDLWFLDVISIGRGEPPKKQTSAMGFAHVDYACPNGMPATKVQLLLRKVMGKDRNVFRRVGVRNPFPNAFSDLLSLMARVEDDDSIQEMDITLV